MRTITILSVSCLFAISLTAMEAPAAPQDAPVEAGTTTEAPTAYYALVKDGKGTNINVRTAASVEGGYPFFQVKEGDLIHVLYERFGWARVRTDTPAFKNAFGYVIADSIDVEVLGSPDGVGTVKRRATFSAPHMMKDNNPSMSWEGLDPPLAVGTKLQLIKQIPATNAGDPLKWQVRIPNTQEAWINAVWLRKATAEELAARMPKPTDAKDVDATPTAVTAASDETPTATTAAGDDTTTETTDTTNTTTEEVVAVETTDEETIEIPADVERAAKLAALDTSFRAILKERIESAELELLQQQFIQFARRDDVTDVERGTATSRAEVLALKIEVQDHLTRLREMRKRTLVDRENINATRVALDARAPYDMVGELNASIVFSGQGTMPMLFRLQDPSGGQTIAYIQPDDRFDIAAMTGLLVGVLGDSSYDGTLQLNVIKPRRIDLLGPREKYPPADEDKDAPTPETVAEGDAGDGDAE